MIASERTIKTMISEIIFGLRMCESFHDFQLINLVYDRLYENKLLDGEPLTIPELRNLLRTRIVNFEFIKLNGDVRPAKGTTMMDHIPPDQHPKGTGHSSPTVATFFDLNKKLWRSVSQRSKEIVLKPEAPGKKPIVVVSDKKPVMPSDKAEFEKGKTYEYVNRYGETGHTATVVEVGDRGYYLKLDVNGPLFYLTFNTANNRIKNEIEGPRPVTMPMKRTGNRAVNRVKDLINAPVSAVPNVKPINPDDKNKEAYDVKDDEIKVKPDSTTITPVAEMPMKDVGLEPNDDEKEIEDEEKENV